jgi:hypothetical protein
MLPMPHRSALKTRGVVMPHPEIKREREFSQKPAKQRDSVLSLREAIGELNALTSKSWYVNADAAGSHEPCFFRVETGYIPMFVTQIWHKFYGQALLETDTIRLSLIIVLAEEAILDHYIELIDDVTLPDEIVDLQNAIKVLSGLREANQIGYVAPQFVA